MESVAGLSPEERTILRSLSLAPFESLTLDKRIVSALEEMEDLANRLNPALGTTARQTR